MLPQERIPGQSDATRPELAGWIEIGEEVRFAC